jgi:regulatory protein SWI6
VLYIQVSNRTKKLVIFVDVANQSFTQPKNLVNNEKSKDDLIEELKTQLNSMSREITKYRKEIDPLRKKNEKIPELKSRIHALERQLSRKELSQSIATVPNSGESDQTQSNEEIARLRMALAHQKTVESHLCQELVCLRGSIGSHELSCKKIIAACCNVSLQHIDELLQPLLEALESDDFNLDMRLISGFLSRIRSEGSHSVSPDVPSEGSTGFLM